MSPEMCLKAFQQGLAQLQQQYGVRIVADLHVEKLGEAMLTRPVLQAALVENWKPPDEANMFEERVEA